MPQTRKAQNIAGRPSGIMSVGIGAAPVNWKALFCQPKPTTWLRIMMTPRVKPISLTSPVASQTKILFATDMHGSEGAWRKFLNASAMLKVNVAICGGDLTGKMIVPIIEKSDGKYNYYFMGKTHTIESKDLEKDFKDVRGIGYYHYQTTEREYEEMRQNPTKVDDVFHKVMEATLKNWLDLIRQKGPKKT